MGIVRWLVLIRHVTSTHPIRPAETITGCKLKTGPTFVISDPGCNDTNASAVLIQGGGGTGATATAVVSNGVVVKIAISNAGTGYTSTPTIHIYSPVGLQFGLLKAVKPSFTDLLLGTNYQLQVSADMSTWTNQGVPFTATSPRMVYPQYWDVDNWNSLYFRLKIAP